MIVYRLMEPRDILTDEALAAMNELMRQLTSRATPLDPVLVAEAFRDSRVLLAVDETTRRVVGMATLCPVTKLMRREGRIEDMVVHEKYRRQWIGNVLITELIALAKKMGLTRLHLTSKPSRVAANRLYQRVGFAFHETNVYTLDL